MIAKSKLEKILTKSKYEDIVWEYDENLIQIISKKDNNNKRTYNLVFNNLKSKYDIMIFLNEQKEDFKGYCNCEVGKIGENCEHLIWAILRINADLKEESKKEEVLESEEFKLDILKDISSFKMSVDEVFFKFSINSFLEEGVKFELKANLNRVRDYKIINIEKFINSIREGKKLVYGKLFTTSDYKLNAKEDNILIKLDYINFILKSKNKSINSQEIDYSLFTLLLKSLDNMYVEFQNEDYFVKNNITDLNIFVKKEDDGSLGLEFLNLYDYDIINNLIAINYKTKVISIIDDMDLKKITLINSLKSNETLENKNKFKIKKEDSQEFSQNILPKVYNEFDIQLDNRLKMNIIDEKLEISLFCYKSKGLIYLKPKFMYGKYDSLEENNNVLIRRNKAREEQFIRFLASKGYEFDPYINEFVIENKRSQFNFLVNDLFDIKDSYEVMLDDTLKNAILNFDSSSINISIKKSKKYDYFELDFSLGDIEAREVDSIITAFEENRIFYNLNNGNFLKLNDSKIYEQLMFVKDVIKDNSYKLNNNRIPKYKAVQLEVEIKNKFNKYDFGQGFLNYIDSIKVIEDIDDKEFNDKNYELREYQKKGISFIANLYEAKLGAMLADEMGLGKTLQAISFLEIKKINSAIIVVPKALIYNWVKEIEKFTSSFKVVVVDGHKSVRDEAISTIDDKSIVITSYNSIINDIKEYEAISFEVVIIDEAQYIKNPTTKKARCVKMLKGEFFIALTGTPIENNLMEMWSIFDFLIPGYFSDLSNFNKKYKVREKVSNLDMLKESLAPFILRRLKKDVLKELPEKLESIVYCEMEELQKKLYYQYNEKVKDEINDYIAQNNYMKKNIEILAAITRLRQMAITPKLITPEYEEDSGKVEVFLELVREIVADEQKVLVFSQYTSLLSILKKKLDEEKIEYYYLDGKTRPKDRLIDVEKFNKNRVSVYFISLKAGGVGLNLTSATNVIIMDPWWNPSVENQAIDRAHRIGQENKVQVYRLVTQGSIEEKIQEVKQDKEKVISQILSTETSDITKMNTDELIKLLQL